MLFGLCNSPASFERLMEIALAGLQWTTLLICLDDVISFSESFEEYVDQLGEVCTCIRLAGRKRKPKKCSLQRRCTSWVMSFLNEGSFLTPTMFSDSPIGPYHVVRDVKAFLGLGNYYWGFV